jgi:hypothetical protein
MYLIGAIIGGMGVGWIIGNYLLNKWIDETNDEINTLKSKEEIKRS